MGVKGLDSNVRLDGLAPRVENVLDLGSLFPDGVEGTRVGAAIPRRAAECRLAAAEVVVGSASDLSHGWIIGS